MKTLSDKYFDGELRFEERTELVKEFIKELEVEFKVAFCLNPDVQYCGECAVCKNVDRILKRKAGPKLT